MKAFFKLCASIDNLLFGDDNLIDRFLNFFNNHKNPTLNRIGDRIELPLMVFIGVPLLVLYFVLHAIIDAVKLISRRVNHEISRGMDLLRARRSN